MENENQFRARQHGLQRIGGFLSSLPSLPDRDDIEYLFAAARRNLPEKQVDFVCHECRFESVENFGKGRKTGSRVNAAVPSAEGRSEANGNTRTAKDSCLWKTRI
jgi:hypothetical protein